MEKPRYIFADMDGTLTKSRSLIDKKMTREIEKFIDDGGKFVVVSGAEMGQIREQITPYLFGRVSKLAQNGNDAISDEGTSWENELNWLQKTQIFNWVALALQRVAWDYEDLVDLVEDRGCQVSFSMIGHNADKKLKAAFDPNRAKRKALLEVFPFRNKEIEVRIGGTTCLDFMLKGCNKGTNIERFIRIRKWKKADCLYLGDALEEGGNDEAVLGVIPATGIKDEKDCLEALRAINEL